MMSKDQLAYLEAEKLLAQQGIVARFNKLVPKSKSKTALPLTKRGLSSCFIKDFHDLLDIDKEVDVLVVLHMIKILTKPFSSSLAELLVGLHDSNNNLCVGTVTRFVSHATSYKARDDQSALEGCGGESAEYFFVDVFSVNQSDPMGKSELGDLTSVIVGSQSTILIFSPWYDPEILRRVWCLYEIMVCLQHGKKLDIAMDSAQQADFVLAMSGMHHEQKTLADVAFAINKLDVSKATATYAGDRSMIFDMIEKNPGGVPRLNKDVKHFLVQWASKQNSSHVKNYLQVRNTCTPPRTGNSTLCQTAHTKGRHVYKVHPIAHSLSTQPKHTAKHTKHSLTRSPPPLMHSLQQLQQTNKQNKQTASNAKRKFWTRTSTRCRMRTAPSSRLKCPTSTASASSMEMAYTAQASPYRHHHQRHYLPLPHRTSPWLMPRAVAPCLLGPRLLRWMLAIIAVAENRPSLGHTKVGRRA
jgi:hypothetical protein